MLARLCSYTGDPFIGQCDCPQHREQRSRDNQRRQRKREQHGRNRKAWYQLRDCRLRFAGYRCELRLPGCTGRATTGHLDPRLHGDHTRARLKDIRAACPNCHGRVDGGRATRPAPAPSVERTWIA